MSSESPYGNLVVDFLQMSGSMTFSSLLAYIAKKSGLRKSELKPRVQDTLDRMEDMGVLKRKKKGQYSASSLDDGLYSGPSSSRKDDVVYSLIGPYRKK